jgi:large subunit ribosomal protein L18
MAKETRSQARQRRHARVRQKISGSANRPRLNVYRSLLHIYAQVIDDESGRTLVSASSLEPAVREQVAGLPKLEQAKVVGKILAERARAKGIESVVFDRGGYPYHGRVQALAEASREGGLVF